VVAIDKSEMDALPGATVLELDFMDDDAPGLIAQALDGPADVILSDMAPQLTGHAGTDHLRLMGLLEAVFDFALANLSAGGCLVAKVFQGGTEEGLLKRMKPHFTSLRHAKPPASRAQSSEIYVIGKGFKP
jgi:23S rRNA (uridine2552-2'-O)-methyltransferase